MVAKVEAIRKFLSLNTKPHMVDLYYEGMEVQVLVAQGEGKPMRREYKGRTFTQFENEETGEKWKSYRIPYNANSKPEYDLNSQQTFDLVEHAEAIGLTGWDWKTKRSLWVAFDFDIIMGDKENTANKTKLTQDEMDMVRDKAMDIPYVQVMKSTSGSGIHLYVTFDKPVPTDNHTEHAALGRAVLSQMSSLCGGFSFENSVDVCGGNMWVWARKMVGTQGFDIVKEAKHPLANVPANWKSHKQVIVGHQNKSDSGVQNKNKKFFDEMAGMLTREKLDSSHESIINYCNTVGERLGFNWWWDNDRNCLVCHTKVLEEAHRDLELKGSFITDTSCKGKPGINCFAYPQKGGSWKVIRYGEGTAEHESWTHGDKWTHVRYNVELDFKSATTMEGGVEDPKSGGFIFSNSNALVRALEKLGVAPVIPKELKKRKGKLYKHKDGRVVVAIERKKDDIEEAGWLMGSKWHERIYETKEDDGTSEDQLEHDDNVRHLVSVTGVGSGWRVMIDSSQSWHEENQSLTRLSLLAKGYTKNDADQALGGCVLNPFYIVNVPFAEEFPGDRRWNINSVQFSQKPSVAPRSELKYNTWLKILRHIGKNIDSDVENNSWCVKHNICDGMSYLKCWLASIIQQPSKPTPYLSLFSTQQETGKSAFIVFLKMLFTQGVVDGYLALTDPKFNAALDGAIICYVEERDLNADKSIYHKVKDWVTADQVSVQKKFTDPIMVDNTTHWIQTDNDLSHTPQFNEKDTRITLIEVSPFKKDEQISDDILKERLKEEIPDFIAELQHMELPVSNIRMAIPALISDHKNNFVGRSASSLDAFIEENYEHRDGAVINYADFCSAFFKWIDAEEIISWTKQKVGQELPSYVVKGRIRKKGGGHYFLGNIKLKVSKADSIKNGKLKLDAKRYLS